MAASTDDFRIVVPFMPSLFRIAMVKVAVPLYNRFHYETLEKAFIDIKKGNSAASGASSDFVKEKETEFQDEYIQCGSSAVFMGGIKEDRKMAFNKAKESLIFIPGHLRDSVMNTVKSLHSAAFQWRADYLHVFNIKSEDCMFYWRSDGTVDSCKTAQELVLNENIDIRKRFGIACVFCLEKSLQSLWAEMEVSRKTKIWETADHSIVNFWIRRMRDERQVPWIQDLLGYIDPPVRESPRTPIPRFSTFFPSLQPEDRQKFLIALHLSKRDDFRFCIYAMTKEEEEKILQLNVGGVLRLYLEWPLQSFFLETAEKVWKHIDGPTYNLLVSLILRFKEMRKDFDYCNLLKDFWNRSPAHLRENAQQSSVLSKGIDSCLNDMQRKRKAPDDEGPHSKVEKSSSERNKRKKWIRKNGRLQ